MRVPRTIRNPWLLAAIAGGVIIAIGATAAAAGHVRTQWDVFTADPVHRGAAGLIAAIWILVWLRALPRLYRLLAVSIWHEAAHPVDEPPSLSCSGCGRRYPSALYFADVAAAVCSTCQSSAERA